jgi:hypothetical protein
MTAPSDFFSAASIQNSASASAFVLGTTKVLNRGEKHLIYLGKCNFAEQFLV